ncbi:hypothetical protein RB595_010413 [Gaeumannomyces hyphopodioides]
MVKGILAMLHGFLKEYVGLAEQNKQVDGVLKSIDSALKNLTLLGVAIRQSGKQWRLRRADDRYSPKDHQDLKAHLEFILQVRQPSTEKREQTVKLRMQIHLIEANLRRRNRFIHAQDHSTRLEDRKSSHLQSSQKQPPQPEKPEAKSISTPDAALDPSKVAPESETQPAQHFGERIAASTISGKSTIASLQESKPDSKASKPAAAKSVISVISASASYPRPPKPDEERQMFRCPCCCQTLPREVKESDSKWRKHLAEDICPYTCVFSNCPRPQVYYPTRSALEHHIRQDHPPQAWICPRCDDAGGVPIFQSEAGIIVHLQQSHTESLEGECLPELLLSSTRDGMCIDECPLCETDNIHELELPRNSPELVDHVLEHIHDFSLRSLPWPAYNPPPLNAEVGTFNEATEIDERISQWFFRSTPDLHSMEIVECPLCETYIFDKPQPWRDLSKLRDHVLKHLRDFTLRSPPHIGTESQPPRSPPSNNFESSRQPSSPKPHYFDNPDHPYFADDASDKAENTSDKAEDTSSDRAEDATSDVAFSDAAEYAPSDAGPSESPPPVSPFPDGVKVLHDCPDATVDICFVHGLTGNRDSTWTADGQSMPWPGTLLPQKLKNARILTYGYDAYVLRRSVASNNRLKDHARNLLNDLTTDRASCEARSRPLIFVAHSLGGLVCKEAILRSRNHPESYLRDIFDCTKGIIFMGTPHKGSWMADWGRISARAIGLVKSTNKSLTEILETKHQFLESIQGRFLDMIREQRESGRRLEVTCFFEELPLPVAGTVVSKESATLEGFTSISIHANHRDMVRFSSMEESGFKRLLGELSRWVAQVASGPDLSQLSQDRLRSPSFSPSASFGSGDRGQQVGQNYGTITTEIHLPPERSKTPPQPFATIPFSRDPDFVNRGDILDQLRQRCYQPAGRVALVGLGGIGKSQLAIEFAHRTAEETPNKWIFWIHAGTQARVEEGFRAIADAVKLPGRDQPKADIPQLVCGWLSNERNGRWTIVLDSADDENVFYAANDGREGKPLASCLPQSRNGSIVVTTRNRDLACRLTGSYKNIINIRPMVLADAVRKHCL